jgi:eukaryotic-like serine/threonine-protein kinase
MVKRMFPCDSDRLRSYLDDDLSPDDQAELAGHLDHCGTCQKALERLAAGSRLWDDLRHLGGEPDSPMPGRPAGGSRGKSRPAIGREGPELEFLAPSEDPAYLGRLGPYEVIGVLGEGGMGIVLKAFEPSLNRVVAIKVLAPQLAASGAARRRFQREAKAAAAVVHDHVVAIYTVDTDPKSGLPYLVMPCIAGRSLQDRIDRDGPLRTEEVLRIGMQTALGLAAAHAQGLVHRDIKPSNILLENGVERVKITDFGLARAIDDGSQSQSGVVAGTPQYMSPEQARGESADHRADLFSLGSVLYAMCAGHSPFRAKTTMGVLRRVCDESPRPLFEINPEVPEALETVIERLHAKDPAMRYQSASEVADVLGRQLAILQRPGARPLRRTPSVDAQTVGKGQPAIKKAEPVDEFGSVRPRRRFRTLAAAFLDVPPELFARPRRRLRTLAAAAMLVLLGLGVAVACARLASREEMPPHFAAYSPPAGLASLEGGQQSTVVITGQDDHPTIVGSGKPATKAWNLADFNAVEIMHPFRAELTRADRFAVSVTADDNVLDHIQVEKRGSRLRIGLEDNRSYRLRRDSLKVAISMPGLEALTLTHSARAVIHGFESKQPFEARLLHGSLLEGTIVSGAIVVDAKHGSEVVLKGTGGSAKLTAEHGSQLPLEGLTVRDAEIQLHHGSEATINARSESDLRAEVHHGSVLKGVVHARNVELEVEHGGQATLSGSATTAKIAGEHSSRLSLADLVLDSVDVNLDHSSTAIVNAKSHLKYAIGNSSSLKFLGNPAVIGTVSPHGGKVNAVRPEDVQPNEKQEPTPASSSRSRENDHDIITISLNSNHSVFRSGAMIEGSGRRATKVVDIKDFNAIRIERVIVADVTRGESFKVTLTADDNILDRIEANREGSTLRIRLAEGNYRLAEPPRVSIVMPALEAIDIAGAARATIQGFASDRPFRAKMSGSSSLEGSIRAGDVDFDISGASTLKLGGSARGARLLASGASRFEPADWKVDGEKLTIDVSGASSVRFRGSAKAAVLKAEGASQLHLSDVALEAADVMLSGASQAKVQVKSLLSYDISAASHLEYRGEPTVSKGTKTGASSVSHRR